VEEPGLKSAVPAATPVGVSRQAPDKQAERSEGEVLFSFVPRTNLPGAGNVSQLFAQNAETFLNKLRKSS
jgi:hypothetical protein